MFPSGELRLPWPSRRGTDRFSRPGTDRLLVGLLRLCALLSAALLLLIVGFLVVESLPALRHLGFLRFLTDASWHPAAGAAQGEFNLAPMIWGSAAVAAGAILLAGPLGLLSAVFLRFYAPRPLAGAYRRLVELLAGIPSIVYGFWGLVTLVPLLARLQPPGASLLAGVLVLGLMVMPTVTLLADSALGAVPRERLQGAAALGLSRLATLRAVALPTARRGMAAGLILGCGRALGETMAVLLVTGNVVQNPDGLFAPVRTLTANIALEMAYAMEDHRSALFVSGLILTGMVALLVAAAEAGRRPQAG